ncbi:MAG TPA: hypothetical protein VEU30_08705 [Thermoanaerobaculia bacterium]|nr:hypothetical protein [Thermoanaerobaculia bacterium]
MRSPALLLLTLVLGAPSARGYEYVAAGSEQAGNSPLPISGPDLVLWHPDDGEIRFIQGLAPAPTGEILAAPGREQHSQAIVLRLDGSSTIVFAGVPDYRAVALIADRAGNIFILADGPSQQFVLDAGAGGTLRAIHPLPALSELEKIDLAADQCTLFLGAPNVISRFNVCTGTPLPDFLISLDTIADFRILPEGGVLAAVWRAGPDALLRYDASGALTRTYPVPAGFAFPHGIALEGTGNVALVTTIDPGERFRLDLESGAWTDVGFFGLHNLRAIVSGNPYTAALGHLNGHAVPALSWEWMAVLAVVLGAVAVRVMR